MSNHRELLRLWLAQCNPNEPIGFLDERYCSLVAQVHNRPVPLRGADAMIPLADCIELSDTSCQLFSGYSGNGKSTELRRLVHLMRERGYTVLLADAEAFHDLEHPIVLSEFLVIVAAAFGEETSNAVGGRAPEKGYWARFQEFLTREVDVGGLKYNAGPAELTLALKHATPFWLEVRHALETSIAKLKKHVHDYIEECIKLLERSENRRVVFILDSLEKLSGPVTSLQQVFDSVVQVFSQHADMLRLPSCHVIYTVPPYVGLLAQNMVRLYDQPMHVLPSIRVFERGEEPKPFYPGVREMVELLAKRVPIEQLFEHPRLAEELALASGGHVRTFISLIRNLLIGAASNGLPATKEHVQLVIAQLREQLESSIRPEAIPALEAIRRTGTLESVETKDLPLLARHMSAQLVLCYRNGDGWYEVHPLVRDDVRRRAEQMAACTAIQSPESQ